MAPHPLNDFGRVLAEARRAAGLTQAELAADVGTTQSAIARLERSAVAPTVQTLCRLADALGITFEIAPRAGLVVGRAEGRGEASERARGAVAHDPGGPTLADLRSRREDLLRIAAGHGAHNVRVFGSVARGQARADSDVDFLVEFEPARTVLDLSGLILDLEEALGRRVDVVEIRRPSSPAVAERIEREAVPL